MQVQQTAAHMDCMHMYTYHSIRFVRIPCTFSSASVMYMHACSCLGSMPGMVFRQGV